MKCVIVLGILFLITVTAARTPISECAAVLCLYLPDGSCTNGTTLIRNGDYGHKGCCDYCATILCKYLELLHSLVKKFLHNFQPTEIRRQIFIFIKLSEFKSLPDSCINNHSPFNLNSSLIFQRKAKPAAIRILMIFANRVLLVNCAMGSRSANRGMHDDLSWWFVKPIAKKFDHQNLSSSWN